MMKLSAFAATIADALDELLRGWSSTGAKNG